jgi:WD40 repeat protein
MYRIAEILPNDGALSMVNEVSFHPSGSYFAATYETINEVRIYDSCTRKLLRVLRNPESQLDGPHGVVFTDKYLLVANVHNRTRPGTINVYRNGGTPTRPIQTFQSPFNHLHEPHSLAIRNGILVITYCENLEPSGAIVSYGFNEETGQIIGVLDKTEAWFSKYGDSKGICFNADGTKILVTFESDTYLSAIGRICSLFSSDKGMPTLHKLSKYSSKAVDKILRKSQSFASTLIKMSTSVSAETEKPNSRISTPTKNGIAVFSITPQGKIARSPQHVVEQKKKCRLEGLDIFDTTCAITDLINQSLLLHDLRQDPNFRNPVQTVNLGNAAPHGVKFSPDGRWLIVSCLGLKIVNQEPQFFDWEAPREDKIIVFQRAN